MGSSGSGKSSLLNGIICEMEKLNGTINVNGTTSYASQEGWLQNDTLK